MDRKELETQVLNMVAMSYKQDINDLSVSTSFKEDLGGASVQMVALVSEIEMNWTWKSCFQKPAPAPPSKT